MLSVKRGRMLIFTLQPVQCCLVVSPLLQFTVGFRRFKKNISFTIQKQLKILYVSAKPNMDKESLFQDLLDRPF